MDASDASPVERLVGNFRATRREWNAGVNNFMTYVTGDIPVGAYDPTRLANLGIGHAAIDGGGGYTYFNPATGHEFSSVAGFTYIFKNQGTQYQNGIDFHVDWGASQFLSKQFLSAWWDMCINRSPTTSDNTRSWADSSHVSSASVLRSDSCSRLATYRGISI